MVETRRLTDLETRLLAASDFPPGELLVALSGGADSAALAYLAKALGQPLRVVHVNHGTAGAEELQHAAQGVARIIDLALVVTNVELPGGVFSEGAARAERYRALDIARRPQEWILTGHTMDDQAETVLLNLFRGAGPVGLAGIPPRNDARVARPLLAARRFELRELAALASLPFTDDPANDDHGFTRNVIRHELIPTVEAWFNPGLVPSLARTASTVNSDNEFLESMVGDLPVELGEVLARVPTAVLSTVGRPLADRVIRRMVSSLRPPYGPSSGEMARIWAVVTGASSGAVLRGEIEVRIDGALLLMVSGTPDVPGPGRIELGAGISHLGRWEIEVADLEGPCLVAPMSPHASIFPAGTVLTAVIDHLGDLTVEADGTPAWLPGGRRLPVAFYESGSDGYLSVFAREDHAWRSSR